MKRLEKHEIAELKARLAEWQTPAAMHDLVDATMDGLGSENLFNQGGLAFLRDAWTTAGFGKMRKAEKVRLVAGNWPDFELEIGGQVEAFEAVEADKPGRQRGLEYRKGIGEVEDDSVEDWIAEAEQAPVWLEAASQKKADKKYGARAKLLIYLNLNEWGIRHSEVVSCFPHATRAVKGLFEEVWVLWKDRAYRVWRQPSAPVQAA